MTRTRARLAIVHTTAIAVLAMPTIFHGAEAEETADRARTAAAFKEISSQIDPGGDLYLVLNAQDALKKYMEEMVAVMGLLPLEAAPEGAMVSQLLSKLIPFMETQGMLAFEGVGVSIVPSAKGANDLKVFVRRDRTKSGSAFWRAAIGTKPRAMRVHQYLPADTVLARSSTSDPKALRSLIEEAVTTIGGEAGAAQLEQGKQMAAAQLGMPLDTLLGSFGDECMVALMLSKTDTVALPASGAGQPVTIPQPSLLMVFKVSDDSVLDVVKSTLAKMQMTLPEQVSGDARMYTIPVPVPAPIPVQVTLARHGDYMLVGSTQEVVKRALAASKGAGRFINSSEYREAFKAAPEASNGMMYVGKRLNKVVEDVQRQTLEQALAQAAAVGGSPDVDPALLKRLSGMNGSMQLAMTIVNKPSGVSFVGETGMDGRSLVGASVAAPVGLMAAIAIPSFIKARTQSQANACINNLRILDAAKEQHALEQGLSTGAEADRAGMLEYVRGATMPMCPQGGVYTVHPIGSDPVCTIPSHSLSPAARFQPQSTSCHNNLRILDAAKEQHAMAQRLSVGAEADRAGMLEYVKGATMPVCPQGGVYTVHPIGTDPACSFSGHGL